MLYAPSRPRRALAALAAAGLAALAVSASADASQPAPSTLLRQYQPVLVFHPSEPFRPMSIKPFVADSALERFVGTSQAQLPLDQYWEVVDPDPDVRDLPPADPTAMYRLNQTSCKASANLAGRDCYAAAAAAAHGHRPVIYGRVVHTTTAIVLQYWLFYYDNPLLLPATPVGVFFQSHEADWELVNVVLDANARPVEAAYSQHCSGQRMPWTGVQRMYGTHPVAYVALGSHANYFAPGAGPLGEIPISTACVPAAVRPILPSLPFLHVTDQVVDGSAAGAVVGPYGPTGAKLRPIATKSWSAFGGRWGESEYFFTPIALGPVPGGTAVPVGLGPASPAAHAEWDVSTVLAWPSR